MDTIDQLTELRKKAELAVADMQESDLKLKAFEIILQHLLSSRLAMPTITDVGKDTSSKKKIASARTPGTLKSRILLLKDEGFFVTPRALSQVEHELKAHGWIHAQTQLSGPLQSLVRERLLRRVQGKVGNKKVWTYVNP
jgi:hypothetical protein